MTGTDTDVGKTFVAVALTRRACVLGLRVFGFKPIESGCTHELGDDQLALVEAARGWQSGKLRGVYQFRNALAPSVAAGLENTSVDLELVVQTFRDGAARADLSIVEGVGGWRAPLTSKDDVGSLALRLDLPLIVVARSGLGTINHSLLTIEAIEKQHGRVAALVLSHRPSDARRLTLSNAEQIQQRWLGDVTIYDGNPETLDSIIKRST